MNEFLDKFGIFDLFTMLIPGIFFLIELLYIFPDIEKNVPSAFEDGVAQYFLFFALSYVIGMLFYEISEAIEKLIFERILRIGTHKQRLFLLKNNIILDKLDFVLACMLGTEILRSNNMDMINGLSLQEKSEFVFNYCLSSLEINNLYVKAEKMLSIAEMSRSIYIMNSFLLIIYILGIRLYNFDLNIFYLIILIAIIPVFFIRTRRYERYRAVIIMRTYAISNKKESINS